MWDKIKLFFRSVYAAIRPFLRPLIREIAASGGTLILTAAKEAVLEAEKTGEPGNKKLELAVRLTRDRLEAAGVSYLLNAIYGAVIAAVAEMNSEQGKQ